MNEKPNLNEYCWNVRNPRWVLLPKVVPGYYLGTILVNLPTSGLPLGSLKGPKTLNPFSI